MTLLLPERVAATLERERWAQEVAEYAKAYNPMLKEIDAGLSLVFVKADATAPGLRPGRFHVRMKNRTGGADLYMPIETEDGGFREPASDILDRLRRCDLQNPEVNREFRRAEERREEDRLKEEARMREARIDGIAGRIKAYDSPSVSFQNIGSGWSYRAGRGVDRRRRENGR